MTPERYNTLMTSSENDKLTRDEMLDGWHFCPDFDYLLCQFGAQPVLKVCTCPRWTDFEIEGGE